MPWRNRLRQAFFQLRHHHHYPPSRLKHYHRTKKSEPKAARIVSCALTLVWTSTSTSSFGIWSSTPSPCPQSKIPMIGLIDYPTSVRNYWPLTATSYTKNFSDRDRMKWLISIGKSYWIFWTEKQPEMRYWWATSKKWSATFTLATSKEYEIMWFRPQTSWLTI